jgi:FMN-dependent NADH-azoreductase
MKPTLLIINSSGRETRSITRQLTKRYAAAWRAHHPDGEIIDRDVGLHPPPPVDERWIAAAFADPAVRTQAMHEALRTSNALIDELVQADQLLIGTPIYNFGLPAQLKAYFDQVVRVGRTFAFDPKAPQPYRPLLSPKPVVVVTATGDGALLPGGALAHLNHLDPHLRTIFEFIGLTDLTFVRVGDEEFQDDRLKRSLRNAEDALDALAATHLPRRNAA